MRVLVLLWLIHGHQIVSTSTPIPVKVCQQMANVMDQGRTLSATKDSVLLSARCE
jgi:hypothetical protein